MESPPKTRIDKIIKETLEDIKEDQVEEKLKEMGLSVARDIISEDEAVTPDEEQGNYTDGIDYC